MGCFAGWEPNARWAHDPERRPAGLR